jgi:hypothetical protein
MTDFITEPNEIPEPDVPPEANEPRPVANNRFTLHTAAEALRLQPPIDWIVKSLFSAGTVSIMFGEPGSKKTYAMLDAAVCIALGKYWLGFVTKQASVLIIDEESGLRRMNRRLGDVMRGHGASGDLPVYYFSLAGFSLNPNGPNGSMDMEMLEATIRETKAKFVLIDTLADVMQGADENSVKETQPIFMGLRKIAENTECAIVIIHHPNKDGSYRGSSAILGALDGLIKVSSKKESPNIDFKAEKSRDGEPANFSAVAHFEEKKFFLTSSLTAAPKPEVIKPEFTTAQKYVLKYLRNKGASLVTDITSNADACTENSAKQALYSFIAMSLVSRVDKGGPGTKATYGLTEKENTLMIDNSTRVPKTPRLQLARVYGLPADLVDEIERERYFAQFEEICQKFDWQWYWRDSATVADQVGLMKKAQSSGNDFISIYENYRLQARNPYCPLLKTELVVAPASSEEKMVNHHGRRLTNMNSNTGQNRQVEASYTDHTTTNASPAESLL